MDEYWLALRDARGIGPLLGRRLVERFGDPAAVFSAGPSAWRVVEGIGPQTAEALAAGLDLDAARRELDALGSLGGRLIPITDPAYPAVLRRIHDAPLVLSAIGSPSGSERTSVAIVGSRGATAYGVKMAGYLASELARAGVAIVSGFALGIDAAAHRGALGAGGRTVAVLGCGLDVDYPRQHRELRREVAASGALISEFPLGTDAQPANFPRRNRIISGLAAGVVVVEAGMKSGSLITARYALEQGREVYAVPGRADQERSRGCNWLIKQGARLVDSPGDVLAEILPSLATKGERDAAEPIIPAGLGDEERRVLTSLGAEPIHIDELIAGTGIPAGGLSAVLLTLELQGLVEQLPGTRYRRKD